MFTNTRTNQPTSITDHNITSGGYKHYRTGVKLINQVSAQETHNAKQYILYHTSHRPYMLCTVITVWISITVQQFVGNGTHTYTMWVKKIPSWGLVVISPKRLGIFQPNFPRLLNVHMYARIPIFIQLSLTVTKLCHIKCDHPACVSVDGVHFEHIMVVAINVA